MRFISDKFSRLGLPITTRDVRTPVWVQDCRNQAAQQPNSKQTGTPSRRTKLSWRRRYSVDFSTNTNWRQKRHESYFLQSYSISAEHRLYETRRSLWVKIKNAA